MAHTLTERVESRIDADLKRWLREFAEQSDRTEGAIIRLALRDYRKQTERKEAA